MSTELARTTPWQARIETRSAKALRDEIGRAFRNGELAAVGPLYRTTDGLWAVNVLRLKDRHVVPAWRRPVLIGGGAVLVLGGAGALGWWAMTATAAALGAVSLPTIAVVAALLWLLSRVGGGGSGGGSGCTTTVTVTHRHHS